MKRYFFVIFISFISAFSYSQDTVVTYYKNNKKASEGVLLKGAEYGRWKYYSQDGKLIQETDFINGFAHGKIIYYYSNGKKKNEGE